MKITLISAFILVLVGCATPVRSTVDSYGEAPLTLSDPLFFDRNSLPLAERPISDACRDAARNLGIPVSDQPCPECRRVEVRSRLSSTGQALAGGPGFGTGIGVMGGRTAFGFGVGTGGARTEDRTERVVEIGIFDPGTSNLVHTISARSLGRDNSVAAVANEICVAAFRDYPGHVKGKVQSVKPGATGR